MKKHEIYDVRLTSENTKNIRANVYKCDVSRTVSTNGNNPRANQGGLAIVNFTLSKNSHFTNVEVDKTAPLVATDHKDPPVVHTELVRRITPIECGRLQGFPDNWTLSLENENPTDEKLEFWRNVFKTHSRLNGKRVKSDKEILKWLKEPYSDSAAYKMWGNGVALPCAYAILKNISKIL